MVTPKVCTQCGGTISQNANGSICNYCGTEYSLHNTLSEAQIREYCACGLEGIGKCIKCGASICESHAYTLDHFDLNSILRSERSDISRDSADALISSLVNKLGEHNNYCSSCIDNYLEKWIESAT